MSFKAAPRPRAIPRSGLMEHACGLDKTQIAITILHSGFLGGLYLEIRHTGRVSVGRERPDGAQKLIILYGSHFSRIVQSNWVRDSRSREAGSHVQEIAFLLVRNYIGPRSHGWYVVVSAMDFHPR